MFSESHLIGTTNLFKITVVGGGGGSSPVIKNSFAILDRLN